jgi:hypothetical protein
VSRDCAVCGSRARSCRMLGNAPRPSGCRSGASCRADVFVDVLQGTQSFWMAGVHFQFATNHRGSGSPLSKCSVLTATVRNSYARNGRGPPKTSWRSGSRTAVRRSSTPDVLVDVLLTALRYLGPQERWVPGRAVSMHRCYKAVMPLNDQQEHIRRQERDGKDTGDGMHNYHSSDQRPPAYIQSKTLTEIYHDTTHGNTW